MQERLVMLFVSAKVSGCLASQGQPERMSRAAMVDQMDKEGFGNCTNTGALCRMSEGHQLDNIARMNRDYLKSQVAGE